MNDHYVFWFLLVFNQSLCTGKERTNNRETVGQIGRSVVFAIKRIWSRLCYGVLPWLHLSCLPPRRHQKTWGSVATQTHRGLQEEEEEGEECLLGWGLGHGWPQFKYSSVRYDSQTDPEHCLTFNPCPAIHPSTIYSSSIRGKNSRCVHPLSLLVYLWVVFCAVKRPL